MSLEGFFFGDSVRNCLWFLQSYKKLRDQQTEPIADRIAAVITILDGKHSKSKKKY